MYFTCVKGGWGYFFSNPNWLPGSWGDNHAKTISIVKKPTVFKSSLCGCAMTVCIHCVTYTCLVNFMKVKKRWHFVFEEAWKHCPNWRELRATSRYFLSSRSTCFVGLKVQISHCGEARRKYRVFSVTREPACTLTFPMTRENGQNLDITVQRYFLEKYKRHLQYVYMYCLKYLHLGFPILCSNKTYAVR